MMDTGTLALGIYAFIVVSGLAAVGLWALRAEIRTALTDPRGTSPHPHGRASDHPQD